MRLAVYLKECWCGAGVGGRGAVGQPSAGAGRGCAAPAGWPESPPAAPGTAPSSAQRIPDRESGHLK
jgi:hypothetical protein